MLIKSQMLFVTWESYSGVPWLALCGWGCAGSSGSGVCAAPSEAVVLSLQSVLDEMMVEQTDLVRLRMVRMSNVPDTLYMVNNAVPQCCHVITHQQVSTNQSSPPSVIANEIPGELLGVRGCLGLGGGSVSYWTSSFPRRVVLHQE